jgi:hypothetical protein
MYGEFSEYSRSLNGHGRRMQYFDYLSTQAQDICPSAPCRCELLSNYPEGFEWIDWILLS